MNIMPNADMMLRPVRVSNTNNYPVRGNDLIKTLDGVIWWGQFEKNNIEES